MVDDQDGSSTAASEAPSDAGGSGKSDATISPYVGGGGGSTLGHRVATSYLADMLLQDGRPETEGFPVVAVAFQTNPENPVDDMRVEAERDGVRVVVHVAARRSPNFAKSDAKTAKLVGTLLDQVDTFEDNDHAYVAVALAGLTNQQRQVQRLAKLARDNSTESAFHDQVHQPGRHREYSDRYEHLTGLVKVARPDGSEPELRILVWSLLKRLWVLDFRVESDDETDWVQIANRLNRLARSGKSGADVRNDLHSARATQFDQEGTAVDRSLVMRQLHAVLDSGAARSKAAWEHLDLVQAAAEIAVRYALPGEVQVPRSTLRKELQAEFALAGITQGAVLITGESGTGKSALALSAARSLAAAKENFQYVVLNLKRARDSVAELSHDLGMPFAEVLREMSAPSRILLVDAADAVVEGHGSLLRELASAAKAAGVGLVLVSADTAAPDVASALVDIYADPRTVEVPGLDDGELHAVGISVPAIAGALRNLPTKSLYRRLAVVDLLARTGATVTEPLDDWACLELIWENLISRASVGSSATARTDALLAMSESELGLPESVRTYPRPDGAALDALREDKLIAPANLMKLQPEFGHDEVRRFSTAVRLAQAESITETLEASGPVRWSMSAAKLACEGKLARATDSHAELAGLVAQFDALGDVASARWKDVPLEAVLEMPNSYDLLRSLVDTDAAASDRALATLVRIVSLHQRHDDMVDIPRGESVVRILVEDVHEPWHNDDEVFRLLCEWLNSALLERVPSGNRTRELLRERLLKHWRTHHPACAAAADAGAGEAEEEVSFNIFDGLTQKRPRRKKALPWQITQERYLQLFALLGPDINDDVHNCLSEVAVKSPSSLQPIVDLGWSAWGLGAHDPDFLLALTETYYIDKGSGGGWRHWNGVRDHQPAHRALSGHGRGSFWVLTRMCQPEAWIPVINRILNHAANVRCRSESAPGTVDPGSKFVLAIDGAERTYVGDTSVWGWYRGNTNGPYPCMSALQAVERWVDRAVEDGEDFADIAAALLVECENLAMPALIVGAAVRHLGADPRSLDRFLVEPLIWQFDSIRVTHEAVGFMRASDGGITNPERRRWHFRDVIALLVARADPSRQAELKALGDQLVANDARFDAGDTTVRGWAAGFDSENMTTELANGGVIVSVKEPEEVEEELAPMRADMARGSQLLGLQNKYWIPARQHSDEWAPPTPLEIAEDLAQARELYEDPPVFAASDPDMALAYVAAAAVRSAATGHPEAFGENAPFAITSILSILGRAADNATDDYDSLRFENDIGTRGAAAAAVPAMIVTGLAASLAQADVTFEEVAAAAAPLGSGAATETCLEFARGCDIVWSQPCSSDTCIHATVYQWALDLSRVCEIGEFDADLQYVPRVFITGDVLARIPHIRPDRLDTSRLSATIRAVGSAAESSACLAPQASRDLEILLLAQATAMVTHETSEEVYFVDDHGAETMSAARALLHQQSRADAHGDLLLRYSSTLVPAPHVFSAFLRDLAAVGGETQQLADAARATWPTLFAHVLDQVGVHRTLYDRSDAFVDYALSHLLPRLSAATETLHNEFGRETFDWVDAEALMPLVPHWLTVAAGRPSCLLELVLFLRRLPVSIQLADGLRWVAEFCLGRDDRHLATYPPLDEWLVEIKAEADAHSAGAAWLDLVDRLVYAGNERLAPYSR